MTWLNPGCSEPRASVAECVLSVCVRKCLLARTLLVAVSLVLCCLCMLNLANVHVG